MADAAEALHKRFAAAVTKWALMYPLGNWGIWGTADDATRDQLAAIADSIAASWGRALADRMMTIRDKELAEALKRKTWAIDQADKQFRARRAAEKETQRMRTELAALVGVQPDTDWGDVLDQVNEIRRERDTLTAATAPLWALLDRWEQGRAADRFPAIALRRALPPEPPGNVPGTS